MSNDKLIIALDYANGTEAIAMAKRLAPMGVRFKIGLELFCAEGPKIVDDVQKLAPVFLDLKLHDIPQTMTQSALQIAKLGVWMTTIHTAAGIDAMQMVSQAVAGKMLVMGVTLLTSLSNLKHVGSMLDAQDQVISLAQLAGQAGLSGVICSPLEVNLVKSKVPNLLAVTPGIRSGSDSHQDQKRTMSASQALAQGSDYLVVGRPVTQAANPEQALQDLLSSINVTSHS